MIELRRGVEADNRGIRGTFGTPPGDSILIFMPPAIVVIVFLWRACLRHGFDRGRLRHGLPRGPRFSQRDSSASPAIYETLQRQNSCCCERACSSPAWRKHGSPRCNILSLKSPCNEVYALTEPASIRQQPLSAGNWLGSGGKCSRDRVAHRGARRKLRSRTAFPNAATSARRDAPMEQRRRLRDR